MASVFDRPMFQNNTAARDRLKKMGNIQDYASQGMFGTGGTMEDTGLRYQQPFGYGEGQVDPGILGAVRQRDLQGSQIVQGGNLSKQDVPMLMEQRNAAIQSIKDAQLSSDPNKFAAIDDLKAQIANIDKQIAAASKITDLQDKSARDFSGMKPNLTPMGPGEADIFQSISERAARENLPPTTMEADARGRNSIAGKPAVTGTPVVAGTPESTEPTATKPTGPTTMEADARGRKPLVSNPAEVAAGLNDPKPEVREKTAADFAKQFTDMSPEYKGIDKGLLLAQIGFAIAAGDSPNAMKNIADGLSLGADTAIKDKAAKAEFDRQIQLTAMQYGLGEAGKLEAEKRAMAREGKNGQFFVADKDLEFGGRKYKQGDNVFVPNSQLWDGGLPAGLSTETSYNALLTTQASLEKAMLEAKQSNIISGDEYKMVITGLNDAADNYASASKVLPILEASLVRVADGKVTGFSPALSTAFNQAANAFGLKPSAEYQNKEQYVSDLEKVTSQMVGDILGEGGKTISDNDRRIVADLAATLNDLKTGIISDPDIVVSKIQDLMATLESKQQKALDVYSTYSEAYGNTHTKSGAPLRSIYAEGVFQTPAIEYTIDKDGRYILSTGGQ